MSEAVSSTDSFERIIREAGQGWLIDWYAPKDQALPALRQTLATADARAQARLGRNAPRLTPEVLVAEYDRNPHRISAFLQVLGSVTTPDLLVMVWRIIQGMSISELRVNYRSEDRFEMSVLLTSPYGDHDEPYESTNIDDSVILRHLGVMKMDGLPIFDGFYPLNVDS